MSQETGVTSKDFFISYNKADRNWAEWIAWQLEAEGYSTILQAWDFRPGSNFILEMDNATKIAKRTIAVLSPDYLDALYTKPEWAEAFRQDPTGQQGKLLPIRVRPCTLTGLLAAIVYIDLVGLNPLAAQNALISGIRRSRAIPSAPPAFPGDTSLQHSPPAFPGSWPLVWMVPHRRNQFFTGREVLLKTLYEQLAGTKTINSVQMLAIYGLGGIGKTQVAVEYAYRYKQNYQAVLWVRAAAYDTLVTDYATIADQLGLSILPMKEEQDQNRLVESVKRWLISHEDWLLILDNADNLGVITDFLPPGEAGHILLTTRDPSISTLAHSIEVKQLEQDEAISLLLQHVYDLPSHALLQQVSQDDRAVAETIAKEMGGLPLALDQARAYIEQTRCGLAQYLEMYKQSRTRLLNWKRRVSPDYSKTVATTWELAFEQVEQHNQGAADLLRLCAFLDPDSIPEALFTGGASELSPMLQQLVEDAFLFNDAIDALRSFSLIRRLEDTKSLTIHRLVQVVIQDRMDLPAQQQWAERTVRLVNAAFPEVRFETQDQCNRHLPQVFACLDLIDHYAFHFSAAAHLLHRAGRYLYSHARNSEAERLLQRAKSIQEQISPPELQEFASILNDLANLYRDQDRYIEAEPLYQRALEIREQVLGPEDLETATTISNLANLYRDRDQYEKAEQLYLRALAIREQVLGPKHQEIAYILNNLALLYNLQARYKEMEPLLQRALSIEELTLPPQHPRTAITLDNLATLYREQGRYTEAEPLYQRVLAIEKVVFPAEHPRTAITLTNLATLYREQGHYVEAEPLYQQALTIRKQVRGAEHPETAHTLDNLATLYREQGRYEEAEPLYQQALTIFEQTQGYEHPEIAITLDNLATLYREQSRYEEAEKLYQRALEIREKVLGSNHPETANTLNNLAILYQAQGLYEKAQPLYQRALDIYDHTLPVDHPTIVLLLERYTRLLQQMDRPEETAQLEARIHDIRAKQ
jgi:tetratricopeptide (TPR) repeat protein